MRIDLPPTHKPPPYVGDPRPSPWLFTRHRWPSCHSLAGWGGGFEMAEKTPTKLTHREPPSPSHQPLSYQEWVCHRNGADRVYINHQEHYV
ncbi:hypothetical protein DPEC_G00361600 [Dallia pectoralis]|nr:hypothetical protein DPEC_G00361600 [Dallia pectoralis]